MSSVYHLELGFDTQIAVIGFVPRIDDKLCSWSALEGLIKATDLAQKGGWVSLVGLFDDEDIGAGCSRKSFAKRGGENSIVARTALTFNEMIIFDRANLFQQLHDICKLYSRSVNPNVSGS